MHSSSTSRVGATLASFLFLALPIQPQTFTVLHTFTGEQQDGASPYAGVTIDRAGNLYGTTAYGGSPGSPACRYGPGCGTVFKLTHKNSTWILDPLHSFAGGNDGADPGAGVIFGPDGSLYGTTAEGGSGGCSGDYGGCGTVFNLKPAVSACKSAVCPWTETVLYAFEGGTGGSAPGDLTFDQAGNIYGTAGGGIGKCDQGGDPCGLVYELEHSSGGWTENVIYRFTGSDGGTPASGVIFDDHGNLYGTTEVGGDLACDPPYGCGTVYQLTPSPSGWTERVLYSFSSEPNLVFPLSGLVFDSVGNLYGTTTGGGDGGGAVFELSPSGNNWTFTTLYTFPLNTGGPYASLTMDAAGNLYGTTVYGGQPDCNGSFGCGNVFKLTPGNGGWTYTSLHNFTGLSDGGYPYAPVILDANGNLYGTTPFGGTSYYCSAYGIGCGVVFEITP